MGLEKRRDNNQNDQAQEPYPAGIADFVIRPRPGSSGRLFAESERMPRKKKQKVFAPPGWRQAIKAKFLSLAFHHNPNALYLLATKGRAGVITAHEWADSLNVAGTWIEQWAEDTLQAWRLEPYLCDIAPGPNNTANGSVLYPPPRDRQTEADVFSFKISATPMCRLLFGITIGGGPLRADEPQDDWERFRKEIQAKLDDALDRYRENAVHLGASCEIAVPGDLDLKLEIAALYVFGFKSAEELGKQSAVLRDRTVVYRWLDDILGLLGLSMKKPGHQPKPKSLPQQ
jgi:hypothetical protein